MSSCQNRCAQKGRRTPRARRIELRHQLQLLVQRLTGRSYSHLSVGSQNSLIHLARDVVKIQSDIDQHPFLVRIPDASSELKKAKLLSLDALAIVTRSPSPLALSARHPVYVAERFAHESV